MPFGPGTHRSYRARGVVPRLCRCDRFSESSNLQVGSRLAYEPSLIESRFTRRLILAAGGGAAASALLPHQVAAAVAVRKDSRLSVPPGACDAHVHVIGDSFHFPMSQQRDYTPPPATWKDLAKALDVLGFERVVVVTPTVYGADNSVTIDAVEQIGRHRARGVILIDNSAQAARNIPKDNQVVGLRFMAGGAVDLNRLKGRLNASFDVCARQNWHLDISMPPELTAALYSELKQAPVPLVFDYFAWLAGGVSQVGFDQVIRLLGSGKAYVKLSEPYRLSKRHDYDDLAEVVGQMVKANPDRILWGSGWPHVDSSATDVPLAPNLPIDDSQLLKILSIWVPDLARRRKILVENPARLYRF